MNLLLHTCCGPCAVYPIERLRQDHSLSAIFFNPNIHPFKEFKRRQETLIEYCQSLNIPLIDEGSYGLTEYMRKVVFNEEERCTICYSWRMEEVARQAAERGFDGFTTTLLYSRYQDHQSLKNYGFSLAEKFGITFIYEDYRVGWHDGINRSKELGMYRQPYCGCVFSEQERYDKSMKKRD